MEKADQKHFKQRWNNRRKKTSRLLEAPPRGLLTEVLCGSIYISDINLLPLLSEIILFICKLILNVYNLSLTHYNIKRNVCKIFYLCCFCAAVVYFFPCSLTSIKTVLRNSGVIDLSLLVVIFFYAIALVCIPVIYLIIWVLFCSYYLILK